jgi:undecaprenyl-diphosphatase
VNKKFIYFFFIFWSFLGVAFGAIGSIRFHYLIQNLRSDFLDILFQKITLLGEEYAIVPVILLLVFYFPLGKDKEYRNKVIISLFVGFCLGGVLPQLGKLLLDDALRPWSVLSDLEPIEGLKMSYRRSFPSGHTTITATWVALWASIANPKWNVPILMSLVVLFVALSRVYLNMHWLHDVLAGGLLGIFSAYIGLWAGGFNKRT